MAEVRIAAETNNDAMRAEVADFLALRFKASEPQVVSRVERRDPNSLSIGDLVIATVTQLTVKGIVDGVWDVWQSKQKKTTVEFPGGKIVTFTGDPSELQVVKTLLDDLVAGLLKDEGAP